MEVPRTRSLSLALLAGLVLPIACGGESAAVSEPKLHFAAIPDNNTTELRERFEPLAAYLAKRLGVPVEYRPTSSFAASAEEFAHGDVQLAWFGGLTGVQARQSVAGARAIAQGAVDPRFKSYFIAHRSTGLELADDFPLGLEGKTFTFGPESSTSGRLMPEYHVRRHTGRSPEEFFGAPNSYSESSRRTAELVEAGAFQAGAISGKAYDDLVAEGKLDPQVCRVIWITPEYTEYSWTVRPELDADFGAGFTERLQQALVSIQDPALLTAISRPEGLVEASNEDFEALAGLARELGLL